MNEFTGERVIPGEVNPDLWNEHFSRYVYAAEFVAGKRVLDAGCGTGYGTARLAHAATSVVGIDKSEDAVAYAHANFRLPNLSYRTADAAQLPFPDRDFDVVTSFELIEHLSEWVPFLLEVRRVLEPDGLFIVSTPNKAYYTESRGSEGPNPFHEHEFEAGEFEAALKQVFPSVEFMLQNRAESIAFYPPNTFLPAKAHIETGRGGAAEAHFFVALCSARPIESRFSYVYMPCATNVLREREQHVVRLESEVKLKQKWYEDTKRERDELIEKHRALKEHLEQQNRWGLQLESELKSAQARIVELQEQFQAEQQAGIALARGYQAKVDELEQANIDKTHWALDTEKRLSEEIERQRQQLVEIASALENTEAELNATTNKLSEVNHLNSELKDERRLIAESKWVRLGRRFGVGPAL